MNDTHPDIVVRFQNLMMLNSSERRLRMGCSMYDTAKKIVQSAVYERCPGITAEQMRKEIFIRFYGLEFSRTDRERILAALG